MQEPDKIIVLDDATRELYTKYDYGFFLERHFEQHTYPDEAMEAIQSSFKEAKKQLKEKLKKNKTQMLFHIDGRVRGMHASGILPMRFELGKQRSGSILNFKGEGESWAYFDLWQRYEKRKIFRKRFWDTLVKTGALLGILLSIIKVIEEFTKS